MRWITDGAHRHATITVRVSDRTMALIRAKSGGNFQQTGTKGDDGWWEVPLSREVFLRITDHAHPGETFDEATFRVISVTGGKLS